MPSARILPHEAAFPSALADLGRQRLVPCPCLHFRGAWPPPAGVAIVGTREPTADALDFTRELAAAVVAAGWAVWSGGARGIDAAAHLAALDRGGRTVVVSPSGFDEPYPSEHAALFARAIAEGGSFLSAHADHQRPVRSSFHGRNAILAAMTLATIVVQAGVVSGARSTAHAARRLDRPLYVVPHAPWDAVGRGCALELENGARAVATPAALIASLRGPPPSAQLSLQIGASESAREAAHERAHEAAVEREPSRAREHTHAHALQQFGEHAMRVFEALDEMPVHADDLCARTALPFGTVAAALLTLTLGAVVVEAPAGFYRRKHPTSEPAAKERS